MKYNQIYGKFSQGTGFWLKDNLFNAGIKEIYSKKIINSYQKQVSFDMKRMGLKKKDLKNFDVMDVGTGRQAIALYQLGAKKVIHYDISINNIKNMKNHIKRYNLPIASFHADICDNNFQKNNKFDFIYLQGIIQHVRNPILAIRNLAAASKHNGLIWFYHYQAGPLVHLYVEVIRRLVPKNINYQNLIKVLKKHGFTLKNIDVIIDDLGCTYRNLIGNNNYKLVMEKYGFTRYYKKDVVEQKMGLDLKTKRTACISAYKKSFSNKGYVPTNSKSLPHLDHFKPKNFILEQRGFIKKVNEAFKKITQKNNKKLLEQDYFIEAFVPFLKNYINYDISKPFLQNQKDLLNCFRQVDEYISLK